jgi:hypothetical protein
MQHVPLLSVYPFAQVVQLVELVHVAQWLGHAKHAKLPPKGLVLARKYPAAQVWQLVALVHAVQLLEHAVQAPPLRK